MKTLSYRPAIVAAGLVALMAATRMHSHFGDSFHLPDASLAVFLLVEAGVLDYLAITQFGVNDYCVTSAYWFLIPTYAVLWYAGRYYARIHQQTLRSLGVFAGLAWLANSVAFVISSGSFYLFSGKFADLSMLQYAGRVAQYYLPYLGGAATYLVPAVLLYAVFTQRAAGMQHEVR